MAKSSLEPRSRPPVGQAGVFSAGRLWATAGRYRGPAWPVFGEEAVLTADLELHDIPRARFDFDPVGHYARPDVFKLVVNESPQLAVEFGPRSADGA